MNSFRFRAGIIVLLGLFFSLSAFSQDSFEIIFNGNMKESDRQTLQSGKLLIKNIGRFRNVMLNPVSPEAKNLLDRMKKLDPAYLAEIVYVVPVESAEHCLSVLYENLLDVKTYPSIPYYSQSHKEWNVMYQFVKITASEYKSTSATVSAFGEITPFEPYNFDIALSRSESSLEFRLVNASEIKFKGVPCVGPGKSLTLVCAFPYGDKMIVYGVGGVNAPYVPILNEKIQTSFINRITTFCSYVFGKISQ